MKTLFVRWFLILRHLISAYSAATALSLVLHFVRCAIAMLLFHGLSLLTFESFPIPLPSCFVSFVEIITFF
uniref:Uncharacterized protein n=1 Tax=Anopheles darlingi TaxID=43151 RepID=A0A2M4D2F4_ANODA